MGPNNQAQQWSLARKGLGNLFQGPAKTCSAHQRMAFDTVVTFGGGQHRSSVLRVYSFESLSCFAVTILSLARVSIIENNQSTSGFIALRTKSSAKNGNLSVYERAKFHFITLDINSHGMGLGLSLQS